MKTKVINSKHVFAKNNQVFIKNEAGFSSNKSEKINEVGWSPIKFQWIPKMKLQEKFKI